MPVLSRPKNAALLVESIRATTTTPYSILFLCSPGDTKQVAACRKTGANVHVVDWDPGRSDYPRKMNLGYRMTRREFILMAADDLTFQEGWDTQVLAVAQETGASVIGTNDCANRQVMKGLFSTHALVRRSYVQETGASLDGPGILVSETYDHNYCDRELCGLAKSRGVWAFAPESRLLHRHPIWRTTSWDDTYAKGKENAVTDHENFLMRCQHWGDIGLMPQELKHLRQTRRKHARLARRRTRT